MPLGQTIFLICHFFKWLNFSVINIYWIRILILILSLTTLRGSERFVQMSCSLLSISSDNVPNRDVMYQLARSFMKERSWETPEGYICELYVRQQLTPLFMPGRGQTKLSLTIQKMLRLTNWTRDRPSADSVEVGATLGAKMSLRAIKEKTQKIIDLCRSAASHGSAKVYCLAVLRKADKAARMPRISGLACGQPQKNYRK